MGEHGGDVLIWVVPFPFDDDDVGTNLATEIINIQCAMNDGIPANVNINGHSRIRFPDHKSSGIASNTECKRKPELYRVHPNACHATNIVPPTKG